MHPSLTGSPEHDICSIARRPKHKFRLVIDVIRQPFGHDTLGEAAILLLNQTLDRLFGWLDGAPQMPVVVDDLAMWQSIGVSPLESDWNSAPLMKHPELTADWSSTHTTLFMNSS